MRDKLFVPTVNGIVRFLFVSVSYEHYRVLHTIVFPEGNDVGRFVDAFTIGDDLCFWVAEDRSKTSPVIVGCVGLQLIDTKALKANSELRIALNGLSSERKKEFAVELKVRV